MKRLYPPDQRIHYLTYVGGAEYLTGMKMGEYIIERLRTANDLNCIGISQVLNGGGS